MYQEKIINVVTGEETYRDYTLEEVANVEGAIAESQAAYESRQAEIKAKAAARQAILDRLGLTAEEAALLLGAN